MKKIVLSLLAMLMLSACTSIPTVNQVETYGEVEEVITLNGHYRVKAWCKEREKYYYIITDRSYQRGDIVRIL